MFKTLLALALFGVAFTAVSSRTVRSADSDPATLYWLSENGELIEEDLTQPMPAPQAVDVTKLIFTLYHPGNKDTGYVLKTGDVNNLRNSGFDNSRSTKVLIHGYRGNSDGPAVQIPKNAYLASGSYNVIGVDYREYNAPYQSAVSNANNVAKHVGALLNFLAANAGLDISKVHIIGHSLGAHISGYVSNHVGSAKIGRITGLDPAGPLFGTTGANKRLDKGDATFVDVIHSSIKSLGITYSIGHVDFWPNGGKEQPRCAEAADLDGFVGGCDHSEAYTYWADSIRNPGQFHSLKCKDDDQAKNHACTGATSAVMGEAANERSPAGVYYVDVHTILK